MKWNTDKMIDLITQVLCHESQSGDFITNNYKGGDYDSDNLCISLYGSMEDQLFLSGFNQDTPIPDGSDCNVEMLELTCHSGNGLMGATPNECEAYGKLMAALRRDGWKVVPNMKDYF